jgi:uncharacterized protein
MLDRLLINEVEKHFTYFPGVVLLGPRQVGKTTLARQIAAHHPDAMFLDLEKAEDRAQLARPGAFFANNRKRLVVLDEVQHVPEIFQQLRPEIDEDRRPGRFLLLGSASGKLLKQSAESLAGRVSYLELSPLLINEVMQTQTALINTMQTLWFRGGFPQSYSAPVDELSHVWRTSFINTFLQRDLPELGVNIPAETLLRFWRMAAHLQGQLFNASQIAASLGGIAHTTVNRYLDVMVDVMMLRRLPPYFTNIGKRLVKSPKVYVRDSGVLHALLGIATINDLTGHPNAGHSWEGFVVEHICNQLPAGASASFYRTAAGAELDVVVDTGAKRIGFEVKFSAAPKVTKGFWHACEDVAVSHAYVVAPVQSGYSMAENVDVISPLDIRAILQS